MRPIRAAAHDTAFSPFPATRCSPVPKGCWTVNRLPESGTDGNRQIYLVSSAMMRRIPTPRSNITAAWTPASTAAARRTACGGNSIIAGRCPFWEKRKSPLSATDARKPFAAHDLHHYIRHGQSPDSPAGGQKRRPGSPVKKPTREKRKPPAVSVQTGGLRPGWARTDKTGMRTKAAATKR